MIQTRLVDIKKIEYKAGYKYQLTKAYAIMTPIIQEEKIVTQWFTLFPDGKLLVEKGYAWDGASGPTFDTKSSMRPSLVHDCFCQLMKERKLSYEKWAGPVNQFFKELCIEDGMGSIRAALWHRAVIIGRGGDPDIVDDNYIQTAP
jgi:hypothetical protein